MAESSVYETILTMGSGTVEYEMKGVILLNNTEEITISWNLAQGDERGVVEWVKKNRLFVKDIQVTTEIILDGIWRSSNYWLIPGKSRDKPPKFTQTFRKGLATTADDKEAYIYSEGDSSVVADNTYGVMFPNVSPVKLDTVITQLTARTTVTAPTYGRTALTGKFVYGKVEGGPEKDGAHNVMVRIKRVVPLTAPLADDLASRKKLIDSGKTIIADGALENGVKQWKDFVWQGLDPDDEAVCLDIDVPAFVNKNIETVNAWAGTSVVGSLYTWDVDDSVEDWVDHRRTRVVEARKAFDMDVVTARVAMESGYVTESWEVVLPITFGMQKDGTAVLQIHAENKKWENIIVGDDPTTASFVQMSKRNPSGWGAGKVMVAKGVPTTSALDILDALEADTSYVIGSAEMQENGEVSAVSASQSRTYDYINEGEIDDPDEQTTIEDANGAIAGQKNTWHRIAEADVDTHMVLAKAYRNTDSTGMGLAMFTKSPNPDGSFDINVALTEERDGTADDDRSWVIRRSRKETTGNPTSLYKYVALAGDEIWTLPSSGDRATRPIPEDGYFWRIIWEHITCKITITPSAAATFVDPSNAEVLSGSFSRPYRKGMFYAEKVDDRYFTPWFYQSENTVPRALLYVEESS